MWARLRYRLRSRLPSPGRLLGSWRLSIVLMVVLAEYYVLLGIWSARSPGHVIRAIAGLLPFWATYALLLVNTGVCLWQRLPRLRHDLSSEPLSRRHAAAWRARAWADADRDAVRSRLSRAGYRVLESPGGLLGRKRRWAALGTYLFHVAFFLVAVGFLLTLAGRREAKLRTAVGETFGGDPSAYHSVSPPPALDPGPPEVAFRVDGLEPVFWRDQLLFTHLSADLTLPDGSRERVRINDPLWLGWSSWLRLTGVGYAPRYEIRDGRGRTVSSAFVKMDLFPPGRRDHLVAEGLPHRIYLQVDPDAPARGGNRTLALDHPELTVAVRRGRLPLAGGRLAPGETLSFEGLTLSVPELRYWGEFEVVRDPGVLPLVLGYLLGFVGLVLTLRGRRAEIGWSEEDGLLTGWGAARPPDAVAAVTTGPADGTPPAGERDA